MIAHLVVGWFAACALWPATAAAQLDLANAHVERLDNGLTLIVLEEHSQPLVSVQMLYRAGARNEPAGKSGLAHFLEHMAFRASKNFPDTEVVSAIYAVGGEWHGYTWLDQTTYFATVPVEHLDLVLRIEADRLSHLVIDANYVGAERGAVLAEMHGYENDPAIVLHDAAMYAAFWAHPYRANTIGWESDIESVEHADLIEFYQRHYHTGNAVLAVAGDVDTQQVAERVRDLFADARTGEPAAAPHTREPPQTGERRIELRGPSGRDYFEVVYHAPSVHSTDFPAFLLLQTALGGSAGINFLQDLNITAVREGAPLAGIAADIKTWYPPAEQQFFFGISGSIDTGADRTEIESRLEQAIALLRERPLPVDDFEAAREALERELVFDVETTEDAAHQLAFFEGLGALETLQGLHAAIHTVTPHQVQQIAARYLRPTQRTVAWYLHGNPPPVIKTQPAQPAPPTSRPQPEGIAPADGPMLKYLSGGLPVIAQRMPLSRSVHVRIVLSGSELSASAPLVPDDPAWAYSSLTQQILPSELPATLESLRSRISSMQSVPPQREPASDPAQRLEQLFLKALGNRGDTTAPAVPAVIAVSGDLDLQSVLTELEQSFGDIEPGRRTRPALAPRNRKRLAETLPAPRAQAQLGYVVAAPPPQDPDALAWQLLLYILSHDYEGRFGKEAISRRGLAYYIDSRYRSDGQRAWVSLATGVDPAKLEPLEALLDAELERLTREPPSEKEIAEAKAHLLGRRVSAAQSNAEITARLARDWLWYGEVMSVDTLEKRLAAIDREAVLAIVPAFVAGTTVVVDVPQAHESRQ